MQVALQQCPALGDQPLSVLHGSLCSLPGSSHRTSNTLNPSSRKKAQTMSRDNCWYQKCPGLCSCQCLLLKVCQSRTFLTRRGSVLFPQQLQCTEPDIFRATLSVCPLPTSSSSVMYSGLFLAKCQTSLE